MNDPSSGLRGPQPVAGRKPLVVRGVNGRDVALGVVAGLLVLGLVIWGILRMGQDVAGHSLMTGQVTGRHFEPKPPEEQITVGRGGLDAREGDGVYTLQVRTPEGRAYTVFVEKPVYDSHPVGSELSFLPPPAASGTGAQ